MIVQTNAQPAIAEPTPRTAPVIQSQEPAFELTRAEIPQFGFSFEYPSTWEVVNESEGEFFAAAQNGAIAVLAEGQEFDGTLEQLAEDFLTTLDSFLNAFEVVNRSERVLRLGNVVTGSEGYWSSSVIETRTDAPASVAPFWEPESWAASAWPS